MKAVILAGGLGTRISEETHLKPKPMVEIGGQPILWHILKIYSSFGINEFVICCGYKGYLIKEYFANYFLHMSDVTLHMRTNSMEVHQKNAEPWEVTLVDTGETTMTGGRLKQVQPYVGDETFCFTYGDGVSDVDIATAIATHRTSGLLATLTAVQPPGRYGAMNLDAEDRVAGFQENPRAMGGGSTGVSLCWNLAFSTPSTPLPPSGRPSPCNVWRPRGSCRPAGTTASGSRWTPCGIGCIWRSCGRAARPPGNAGESRSVLQELAEAPASPCRHLRCRSAW